MFHVFLHIFSIGVYTYFPNVFTNISIYVLHIFSTCFKWSPPQTTPYDMKDDEFQKHIQTKDGLKFLEKYHTSRGLPIGSYDKLVDDPFEKWKKLERVKYEKYYNQIRKL